MGFLVGRIVPFLPGDLRSPAAPRVNLPRHLALYEQRIRPVQVRNINQKVEAEEESAPDISDQSSSNIQIEV